MTERYTFEKSRRKCAFINLDYFTVVIGRDAVVSLVDAHNKRGSKVDLRSECRLSKVHTEGAELVALFLYRIV